MTVKELMAILASANEDGEVFIHDAAGNILNVADIFVNDSSDGDVDITVQM